MACACVESVTAMPCTLSAPCRAFYEAGMAWKAAGQHSMAFVILNRFLDMADAQDDPGVHSLADLENADFANTGTTCVGGS